jgi:tRNA dimethylallyltransferase
VGTLIIAGTTGSGKSALAVRLAREHGAVIVSADAMTVYRGLDIGTAKPTVDERGDIPHFGFDIRAINEAFDVSDFVSLVDAVRDENPRVIIAGGTTFWLSALVRPLAALPASDPTLRAELEGLEDPHAELAKVDAEAASRLHPNDRVRVIRALEVFHLAGEPQTVLHARGPRRAALDAPVIWLDRDDLRERIDLRISQMLNQGYVEETREALRRDPEGSSKPLQSFAYRHIVAHIRGDIDLPEAERRTGRDTWHYARKQRTWARGLGWTITPTAAIERVAESTFSANA